MFVPTRTLTLWWLRQFRDQHYNACFRSSTLLVVTQRRRRTNKTAVWCPLTSGPTSERLVRCPQLRIRCHLRTTTTSALCVCSMKIFFKPKSRPAPYNAMHPRQLRLARGGGVYPLLLHNSLPRRSQNRGRHHRPVVAIVTMTQTIMGTRIRNTRDDGLQGCRGPRLHESDRRRWSDGQQRDPMVAI